MARLRRVFDPDVDHEPRQAPAVASRLRRGLPAGAARRCRAPAAPTAPGMLSHCGVSVAALRDALSRSSGAAHVSDDAGVLAAHAVDGVTPRWWPGRATPRGEPAPRLASAERLAVAPRGERLERGARRRPAPARPRRSICRALAAITSYVPEDMVASVEAGASRWRARGAARPAPPALARRSAGGRGAASAACSPPGPAGRSASATAPRATSLLGVRFVQADGTITWGGSRVVKSVTGYDVPKLLVGSLGTLGVLVGGDAPSASASRPPRRSWLIRFASAEAAGGFLAALLDTAIEPARVALLDAARARRDSAAARRWPSRCPSRACPRRWRARARRSRGWPRSTVASAAARRRVSGPALARRWPRPSGSSSRPRCRVSRPGSPSVAAPRLGARPRGRWRRMPGPAWDRRPRAEPDGGRASTVASSGRSATGSPPRAAASSSSARRAALKRGLDVWGPVEPGRARASWRASSASSIRRGSSTPAASWAACERAQPPRRRSSAPSTRRIRPRSTGCAPACTAGSACPSARPTGCSARRWTRRAGRVYLMRAAAEGRAELTPSLARHLDLCLGCRACETACPSGVPFGHILEATRGQLERAGRPTARATAAHARSRPPHVPGPAAPRRA